jgi:hypothetical protein
MRDFFIETIALERIELITRLVSLNQCEVHDKEVAFDWVAELMADVVNDLEAQNRYKESK